VNKVSYYINLDTAVRFSDHDFLLECKISRFGDVFRWFLYFICWMSAIFLLPVCLTYWPRKNTTRVDPHVDNSHQVWSWYDHTLPSYSVFACWYVTWPCDLDLWPFDLKPLSYMAGNVTNPATKFVHELRVITFPVDYHSKCVRCHSACAESREPWVGGQKQLYFWNFRPRFVYALYNFHRATTTIKGRLLSSRPMLKPFSGEKIVPSKWGPKMFFGGKWGPNLRCWFRDPQKALPCAEPRRLTYFASKSVRASRL